MEDFLVCKGSHINTGAISEQYFLILEAESSCYHKTLLPFKANACKSLQG